MTLCGDSASRDRAAYLVEVQVHVARKRGQTNVSPKGIGRDPVATWGHYGLSEIVAPDQHRGLRNAVLVGDKLSLACIRRMKELESADLGPQEAAARIIDGVSGNGDRPRGNGPSKTPSNPQLAAAGPDWIAPGST